MNAFFVTSLFCFAWYNRVGFAKGWVTPRQFGSKVGEMRPQKQRKHMFLSQISSSNSNDENSVEEEMEDGGAHNLNAGRVVRIAVRPYHPQHYRPNSRAYTTRKVSVPSAEVTRDGVQGDYNHYRSVALDYTPDRAVSLWTTDCLDWLKEQRDDDDKHAPYADLQPGDVGENVLIDGVDFDTFEVGHSYRFVGSTFGVDEDYSSAIHSDQSSSSSLSSSPRGNVEIQITEHVIPCANLCKLPYINQSDKTPKERIAACQRFLEVLDQAPGLRGWYAKVLTEGTIHVSDRLERINNG